MRKVCLKATVVLLACRSIHTTRMISIIASGCIWISPCLQRVNRVEESGGRHCTVKAAKQPLLSDDRDLQLAKRCVRMGAYLFARQLVSQRLLDKCADREQHLQRWVGKEGFVALVTFLLRLQLQSAEGATACLSDAFQIYTTGTLYVEYEALARRHQFRAEMMEKRNAACNAFVISEI